MEEGVHGGGGSCISSQCPEKTQYSGSFSSLGAYARAVCETPQRLAKCARALGTVEEELKEVKKRSGCDMIRKLRWYDVMGLGVGGMVGAGVFVSTGRPAHLFAGPAIILSYAVAGLAALLSAVCYSEFAAEVPAAGGAFSYLRVTFGELAAYLTGMNLIMEYVISNAAVARSFMDNLATAVGVTEPDAWRIEARAMPRGFDMLDLPAMALVGVVTVCICRSTKCSATVNTCITLFHLLLIGFIVVAGFAKGSPGNLVRPGGFAPYGARGVFSGAAIVYYSYIGYDSVSTMAEETEKPAKALPIGISGSVVVVTVLYCLMAAALVMLVPYTQIDETAPFPLAFKSTAGWSWASNLVGLCACIGILSSLLVAMLGQARYLCVIGRAHIVPLWFARVSSLTGTPVNASLSLGLCTGLVALFTSFNILMDLISIGTLFVFYMVANALILRRHVSRGTTSIWPTMTFLVVITGLSGTFVTLWQFEGDKSFELIICGGMILLCTVVFKLLVPSVKPQKQWESPLMPYVAVGSVFMNVFLSGCLKPQAFERFGLWCGAILLFYLGYSVHAAHDAAAAATISKAKCNGGLIATTATTATPMASDDMQQMQLQMQVRVEKQEEGGVQCNDLHSANISEESSTFISKYAPGRPTTTSA